MGHARTFSYRVEKHVTLHTYFDRARRLWWAYYEHDQHGQMGDAWTEPSREQALIFRPPVPTPEPTLPFTRLRLAGKVPHA